MFLYNSEDEIITKKQYASLFPHCCLSVAVCTEMIQETSQRLRTTKQVGTCQCSVVASEGAD